MGLATSLLLGMHVGTPKAVHSRGDVHQSEQFIDGDLVVAVATTKITRGVVAAWP